MKPQVAIAPPHRSLGLAGGGRFSPTLQEATAGCFQGMCPLFDFFFCLSLYPTLCTFNPHSSRFDNLETAYDMAK